MGLGPGRPNLGFEGGPRDSQTSGRGEGWRAGCKLNSEMWKMSPLVKASHPTLGGQTELPPGDPPGPCPVELLVCILYVDRYAQPLDQQTPGAQESEWWEPDLQQPGRKEGRPRFRTCEWGRLLRPGRGSGLKQTAGHLAGGGAGRVGSTLNRKGGNSWM